jgi:hypothetical protein
MSEKGTTFVYRIAPSHRKLVLRAIVFWYDIAELDLDANNPNFLAGMVSLEQLEVKCVHEDVPWVLLGKLLERLREWTEKPEMRVSFELSNGFTLSNYTMGGLQLSWADVCTWTNFQGWNGICQKHEYHQ